MEGRRGCPLEGWSLRVAGFAQLALPSSGLYTKTSWLGRICYCEAGGEKDLDRQQNIGSRMFKPSAFVFVYLSNFLCEPSNILRCVFLLCYSAE